MKITPISTTTFDWTNFLQQFPNQLTTDLNRAGVNLQSCEGFVKLMSAYESYADNNPEKIICDYLLNHWSIGCYFEMPYFWIEEFRKTDLHVLAIPKGRDMMSGLLTGTVKEWKQSYYVAKQSNNEFFEKFKTFIEAIFQYHKIGFLLEKM